MQYILPVRLPKASLDAPNDPANADEVQAAWLLEAGLKKLGLTQEEPTHLRQNDLRKQGLMWLVKSRTVVKTPGCEGNSTLGTAATSVAR